MTTYMLQEPKFFVFILLYLCSISAESTLHACHKKCVKCDEGRCQECRYGWFGHNCSSKCSNCWITGCHKETGKCNQCSPGRYKVDCGTACPDNCRTERDGLKYCRRADGYCQDGCKKGYWGNTCSKKCLHCETGHCLQNNGHCTGDCRVGWFGPGCDKQCSVGCLNDKCKWNNGECTDGCKKSLYGKKCTTECSANCNRGVCNSDGRCQEGCLDGFRGKTCNETCPFNCLTCEQDGDICTKCKLRWFGKRCQQNHTEKEYKEEEEARAGAGQTVLKSSAAETNYSVENVAGPSCDWPVVTISICISLSLFRRFFCLDTTC